jgi:hypothetical protein
MSNYKRKEVMDYLTRKPVTQQDFQVALDINSLKPVMQSALGVSNPQDRILELADGGRIELAGGGDPEKIARIKELVKSGKYNKTQIIDILKKEGYGRTRTGKDSLVNKIADDLEVNLPQGLSKEGFSAHEAKGKYLPFYNNQKLKIDLENGKTLQDIGKELYKNNKKFYNNIGITENNISVLNNAISSKIRKNEDFISLHDANVNKNIKQQEQVLKDVDLFIKNNKQKYLTQYQNNKVGAPDQFKNDLLDFIEKEHPDFIKITETYNPKNPLAKGSRVLDLPDIHEREITKAGDYGRDVFLKKKIRESLGIAERPAKGEGISFNRMARNYNITTQELLKKAQSEGIVPKINPISNTPINSEASYYRYAKQTGVDPINTLFEGQVKFGVEHVGGIARAGKIGDYETLDKVLAMDSYTNRMVKSNSFDRRITNLIEIAKQSEPTKAKEYIETINDLVIKAEKQYGIPLTKYKLVKNEITPIHPNISLTDTVFKKAKLAINNFITNDGLNHPNFEKLDPDLQKTIVNYSKDKIKEGDSLLKGVLKEKGLSSEIIPGMRNILDSKILNNLVEVGSPAVNSIIKNASNLSKATGLPFNAALGALFNSEEMQEKGLSIPKGLLYGGIKGGSEDLLNFGAQVVSAIPLMSKTLFDATINAQRQPPEGIDSFDQIGGKQGTQNKFFNKLFNISPFDISEIPIIGSTWAAEQQTTKKTIDNLINLETRKEMAKLYPSPDISETTVPGENNIMQKQEMEIKKNLYQEIFKDQNLKTAYEQDLLKEKQNQGAEIKPRGLYNAEIITPNVPQEYAIGGRVKFAEGSDDPESDLYIPPLNKESISGTNVPKEGIDGLYFRTRDEQRPIPVDPTTGKPISSGGIRELKQVFSSLLSDTRPEAGYRKGNIDFYASKGINPFQGDTDFKYGASYTPEGNVGKFMIDKTPQYLGAGYTYQKDGLDFGITGLKDERGDKSIALRFGYNYATGGRVGFKDGPEDPNKLIPIDPLLQDQSPTDPGRRNVLKLGIAGAGLLGLGKLGLLKLGSVAKPSIIAEAVKGTTAPSWMEGLMTKILKEGTEIKMPKESSIIKKEVQFKNPETGDVQTATLTIDSKSDRMFIEYDSPTNVAKQPVVLELYRERKAVQNPGGKSFHLAPDETKGYNFYTSEAGPRVTDWDGNIEFDREDTYRKIIELKSDISGLKSYATEGKGIDKKIAKEKRKATADIEKNPEEYVPDWEPEIYD